MGKTGIRELRDHVTHLCHQAMWTRGIVFMCLVKALIAPCQFGNSPHIFIISLLYQLATLEGVCTASS